MIKKLKTWERPLVRRIELTDAVADALAESALKQGEQVPEILSKCLNPEPHYEKRQAGKR
jgi:hypothetical protein